MAKDLSRKNLMTWNFLVIYFSTSLLSNGILKFLEQIFAEISKNSMKISAKIIITEMKDLQKQIRLNILGPSK